MKATFCKPEDLEKALAIVNERYDGNIAFHSESDIAAKSFRLVTKSYDLPGYGISTHSYQMGWTPNARRKNNACWHVHGYFFDALFSVNPNAKVKSRSNTITKDYGNWEDFNVGSQICPCYASECCTCDGNEYPLAKRA